MPNLDIRRAADVSDVRLLLPVDCLACNFPKGAPMCKLCADLTLAEIAARKDAHDAA